MPIRAGFHTITPYVCLRDAAAAIEFFRQAFQAEETLREADPDGKIRHAEIRIGDSMMMLHDEFPEYREMRSVQTIGDSGVNIFLYVEDADATVERALGAGATLIAPLGDKPYGRSGGVKDPFGITWWVTTHKE